MAQPTHVSSRWSVRTYLAWLVLACLLPGIIGAAVLFIYQYREGHAQLERSTILTARALAQAVDHHLHKVQILAQTLATDDSLARRDFARFHRRAREAMVLAGLGTNVVLRDRDGRQIVNTAVDFGRPLLAAPVPEQVRAVFETGKPTISDVFIGPVFKRPIMSVDVPVIIDGKVAYALAIGILAEHFNAILADQNLPPDWVAAVVDRSGTIFGRTHSPEKFIGLKAKPELLLRMRKSPEGSLEATTQEGIPVLSFYSRSSVTGWGVAIGIPRQAIEAALRERLALLALGMAGLFGIGLLLAWFTGGKIARSVSALTAPALELGKGGEAHPPQVDLKEAAEVAAAIKRAAGLLKDRNAKIEAREEELAEAHRLARFGTWCWDLKTGQVTASESLREIFGRELPPFQEQRGTLLTVESWEKVDAASAQVAQTGGYNLELQANHANGTLLWIRAQCVALRGADGEIFALRGALLDITEQKRAEEQLRQERSRLQAIIDNSPLLIMVKDMESRVVLANQAIFENLKVPPREQLIGHTVFEAFPQNVAQVRWVNDLAAMAQDAPFKAEETIEHVDGTWHTYVTVRFPVHDIETQALLGVCAISTDITDRKEAEEEVQRLNADLERRVKERTIELEQSNEALLQSNLELKNFAHAAAHDLQTPLRSIAGFSQLLQHEVQDVVDGRVQQYSSLVIENTKRLQTLIDHLLAYTRLDAQGLPFEPVDLRAVAEDVIAALAILIRETGAEVHCGPLPTLSVDRIQIAQVLQNLIENGIKYNQSKPPRVSIAGEFQQDRWLFAVTDNGIGIDPKFHERIFEIFRRLHSYQQVAGSGIGLALCRRIVERHGGHIWVESRDGEGSTFYFSLPARDEESRIQPDA